MDLTLDCVDRQFRGEVRAFFAEHRDVVIAQSDERQERRRAYAALAKLLHSKGWLAPHWPGEWGGSELPPIQRYILEEELAAAQIGRPDRIGLYLAGPVLYSFGSLEQQKRYLPGILSGEELWCQGFSEPESGSDVNSVRTTATPEGAHYVVEGEKIWTSNAHLADMMFALVRMRTSSRPDRGLTFILIDVNDPRVSISPIISLGGEHHFNRVLLDRVSVPKSNVVGEIGKGWEAARSLLANERIMISGAPETRSLLHRLKRWEALRTEQASAVGDDIEFARRLAQLEIDLSALEFAIWRVLYMAKDDPQQEGLRCAIKIRGAELKQRTNQLAFDALDLQSLNWDRRTDAGSHTLGASGHSLISAQEFLFNLSSSIAGGTSEIQRNVIASAVLGLY